MIKDKLSGFADAAFRWYFSQRYKHIQTYMREPYRVQLALLTHFINSTKHTSWGKEYDYQNIKSYDDFAKNVPVQDYDGFKPYIQRMMYGEKDVLWSGAVRWFSKSSGTTSDKSKFIPVTSQNLKKCHIRGTWDAMTLMYHQHPNASFFKGKNLIMGGSYQSFEPYPKTKIGDVSAIMLQHFPPVGKPFYAPDFETALMPNFEEKIERMAHILSKENMIMLGGVPTWSVVLFRRILEITGKDNLLEVWPNLQAYIHGGVSFVPYKAQFKEFIPKDDFIYQEIYNASEGFFAVQNEPENDDMLLLLDNGIFYELLPQSEWSSPSPKAIPLWEAEVGVDYALVITTNSGLWRYIPGDTVIFTSVSPYKIKITGRTKQFVNAFGEEVMVANTDKALDETCRIMNAKVLEYTVAPIYFQQTGKGGHEWIIEFEREPIDIESFNQLLDDNLQKVNSDYEAKRYKNMALQRLCLKIVPRGTFTNIMKAKGKFGGQCKVPRLANDRKFLEEVLHFVR